MTLQSQNLSFEQEISLRQSMSAAEVVCKLAEQNLEAAKNNLVAIKSAMRKVKVSEQIDFDDNFDMCGEGYPPDVLIYLHENYPANDPSANEIIRFYNVSVDFLMSLFREDLSKFPLEYAIKRHEWALTALRFKTIKEVIDWASADADRMEWLATCRGYSSRGILFSIK